MSWQQIDIVRVIRFNNNFRFVWNSFPEVSVNVCRLPDQLGDGEGGGHDGARGGGELSHARRGRHSRGGLCGGCGCCRGGGGGGCRSWFLCGGGCCSGGGDQGYGQMDGSDGRQPGGGSDRRNVDQVSNPRGVPELSAALDLAEVARFSKSDVISLVCRTGVDRLTPTHCGLGLLGARLRTDLQHSLGQLADRSDVSSDSLGQTEVVRLQVVSRHHSLRH